MRQAYVTASGIPYSNRELMNSTAYRGLDQMHLTCDMLCLSKCVSRLLLPSVWHISVSPTAPVVIKSPELLRQVRDEPKAPSMDQLMTLRDHGQIYKNYRQQHGRSPYGFPFTLRTGGFLYVEREGEAPNKDPRQFVLKQTGAVQSGLWAPPNGLASEDFFTSLCRNITRESGIVLLDEKNHIATVVVPKFVVEGKPYSQFEEEAQRFDGEAVKRVQAAKIRSALEFQGYGDYRIAFQNYDAVLTHSRLPERDLVHFTYPYENGSAENRFLAFVAKDRELGSANIHLPFKLVLPADQKLITIDCSGTGRETALKTRDELMHIDLATTQNGDVKTQLSTALSNLFERPFEESRAPQFAGSHRIAAKKIVSTGHEPG